MHGVSTRSVDAFVKAMGGTGVSKSQVSRWIDATYLKVREAGRIVSVAVIVAVGVSTDGRREVLGVQDGAIRGRAVLEGLPALARGPGPARGQARRRRRPQGSEGGGREGVRRHPSKVSGPWLRNALAHVPSTQRPAAVAMLKTIFAHDGAEAAHAQWRQMADALRERFPKLAELMDNPRDDVLAYTTFPREHWAQIASTNPLERLNGEIKRRADVVGIFPNQEAHVRLVGALMLEQNDAWAISRRYMSLESLSTLSEDPALRLPAVAA